MRIEDMEQVKDLLEVREDLRNRRAKLRAAHPKDVSLQIGHWPVLRGTESPALGSNTLRNQGHASTMQNLAILAVEHDIMAVEQAIRALGVVIEPPLKLPTLQGGAREKGPTEANPLCQQPAEGR